MNKCLFLDFDGVLFDTLKEAYLICRYAFDGTDFFEPVDEEEYKKFYRYKFLVYNSWQYYYVMKLLRENLTDDEFVSEYNNFMANRDLDAERVFDEKYYGGREILMKEHHDFWDKLETPFPFFEDVKKVSFDIVIVSKKNKKAICYRLNQYGANIPEDKIFGRDELLKYKTKAEFISEYMGQNNIDLGYFVDDNSNNLDPCEDNPDIIPLLAGWGNVAIGQVGLTPEEITDVVCINQ